MRNSQFPNDVRFVFPGDNGGPELEIWCNKDVLSKVSSHFNTLLSSDFLEGSKSSKRRKIEHNVVAKDFVDSDDERDVQPRSNIKKRAQGEEGKAGPPFHEVVVTYAAYTTYAQVVNWITTGRLTLNNGSHEGKDSSGLYPCSPSSLYRLSHYLEIDDLTKYALDTIRAGLTINNAASVLFSDHSITYKDVKDVALKYVTKNWKEVKETEAMKTAEAHAKGGRAEDFGPIAMELLMLVK